MQDLKTIFRQQSQLKWNHCLEIIEKVKYLLCVLCVIHVLTKYVQVKRLKDKKGKTVLNAFLEIVNESNRKPNKIWVGQGREFYNKLMQKWLGNIDILIYSTHIEDKSVIAKSFIEI